MKIVIVIQARTSSTRLPNKVLLPVAGKPMLERMIERVGAARGAFEMIVATTHLPGDDPIRSLCKKISVRCHSGHVTDLLDRHYSASAELNADVVVKIPSDCPLISPSVIERVLNVFLDHLNYDFVSNLHPATYPDGNDVEVITFEALERALTQAKFDYQREHTTPFFWDQPELFRIANVEWETGLDYSMSHRWTVEYPEDYQFVRSVFEHFGESVFELSEILRLLEQKPELMEINRTYAGVNWYRHNLEQLKTTTAEQTRFAPAEQD